MPGVDQVPILQATHVSRYQSARLPLQPGRHPASTVHSTKVVLIFGYRLRRWPNIKTTSDESLLGSHNVIQYREKITGQTIIAEPYNQTTPALSQCLADVIDAGPIFRRRWIEMSVDRDHLVHFAVTLQ